MQRMDFETLVQTRKSVRGFRKEPVARAVIEDVIEVANLRRHGLSDDSFRPMQSAPTASRTAISSAMSD